MASESFGKSLSDRNSDNTGFSFGMSSFNKKDREAWGQSVRLAMACIDGKAGVANNGSHRSPGEDKHLAGLPLDKPHIAQRLKLLSRDIASSVADQIELLVRFDELEGWKESGAKHCVAWMNAELGISAQLGWERLRVGRELQRLPTLTALFRSGSLSWSKVRLLTRVANADNECLLCHAALDASVSDVDRLCQQYRWLDEGRNDSASDDANAESEKAMRQYNARSLSWRTASNGNTEIRLCLPVEQAQGFLRSIEHCLEHSSGEESTITQRRADAAVLMAERSLDSAGREVATADRYQVVISVEADSLSSGACLPSDTSASHNAHVVPEKPVSEKLLPAKRPMVDGAGPIARETARRIACDASLVTLVTSQGEPVNIGRKSRLWTPAMTRAIKARDQHCQFPGCTANRHLQIHHIVHWADGGSTSIDNGVCLCSYHHTRLHEGGLRIQRVTDHAGRGDAAGREDKQLDNHQFKHQCATAATTSDVERLLRNSESSFDVVRSLLPTRYRFRIVDRKGSEVSNRSIDTTRVDPTKNDSAHMKSLKFTGQYRDNDCDRQQLGDWVAECSGLYSIVGKMSFNPTASELFSSC